MKIKKYPDLQALNRAAADCFLGSARRAVAERGAFHVALAGGNTPKALYKLLAAPEYRKSVPWEQIHIYFGDERSVPPDHNDSNYRMAYDALLGKVPIPERHIHRIKAETGNALRVADDYAHELCEYVPVDEQGRVELDLVLLGVGTDGHTASLFPATDILHENKKLVKAVYVEEKQTWRISMTFPVLNSARQLLFLVVGRDKSKIIKKVFEAPDSGALYPVQLIDNPKQLWLLDQAAAELLTHKP